MFSSTTSLLICVGALWLTQRLLSINQIMKFQKQLAALRRQGRTSVATAKRRGRRVYVALAFDDHSVVTDNLVLRGWTVFSRGRQQPELIGCRAPDLAGGRMPAVLPPLVDTATREAAGFLLTGSGTTAPTARRAVTR